MAERFIKSAAVKFIVFGSLAIMLATIISAINHSFSEMFLSDMKRTVEMIRISNDNVITFSDLQNMKDIAGVAKVSGYSEIIAGISNKSGVYAEGVKVILIDEDYSSIYKNKLLSGSFPDEDLSKKGKAYAAISDQLALKLFMSTDAVGNEIEIFKRNYTISGIYKSRNSVFWSLCGDGFDRVFIPYRSIDNYAEMPVDVMSILKKQDQSITDIETKLNTRIENKMTSYRIIDHMISSIVFHQYFDLLLFIIGLLAIIISMLFTVRYTAGTIRLILKKVDSCYFFSSLKIYSKRIASNILIFLLCFASAVLIINAIRFKFFIADKYIPDDNIFDIKFYLSAINKDNLMLNSIKINVYSIFDYYYKNILHIEMYCTLLIAILLIVSHMFNNLLLQSGAKFKYLQSVTLIAIMTGGATGVSIAALSGLGVTPPVKVWAILLLYLLTIQLSHTNLACLMGSDAGKIVPYENSVK